MSGAAGLPAGGWSSLPNLHAALVHFPIALLAVALAFDAAALVLRRHPWLDRAGAALWALGAAGAGAAYLSGRRAADGLGLLANPSVDAAVVRHADAAWWTLLAAVGVALTRLGLAWAGRRDERIRWLGARAGGLALGAGLLGLLLLTADRGGALVYRHGIAVIVPRAAEAPAPEGHVAHAPVPRERLVQLDGGGVAWLPVPGDGPILSDLVAVVTDLANAMTALDPAASPGEGLGLRVDGQAFLLLPGDWRDVQVEARLDLSGFEGTAGVVHHYQGAGSFGSFEVAGGRSRLVDRRGSEPKVIGEGATPGEAGVATIAVSSVGSHVKGYVGGKTVAHGHVAAPVPGRVGLLLAGRGVVRVHDLRARPVEGH